MENLFQNIHATKDYERNLSGSYRQKFNEHLDRWYNDKLPDKTNENFFVPIGDFTTEDLREVIAYQKSRGLKEVMFQLSQPMEQNLIKEFGFEEEKTLVMALLHGNSSLWSENTKIEIRDSWNHDLSEIMLDCSEIPEEYRELVERSMRQVVERTKIYPEYRWLYAFADGKPIANMYILCHKGMIEMDDLWVHPDYRKQYIATTLMKHVVEHYDGMPYLHANAAKTPKDMYAKMGFEVVETTYEYYKEW